MYLRMPITFSCKMLQTFASQYVRDKNQEAQSITLSMLAELKPKYSHGFIIDIISIRQITGT